MQKYSNTFTIDYEPVAKGRPKFSTRGGFVRAYTPKKTEEAEQTLRLLMAKYKPQIPIDTPVKLSVVFCRRIPKSTSKANLALMLKGVILPMVKPDLDNYLKLIQDAMNGIFFNDDAQICECISKKIYSQNPRTIIKIEEL